MSETLFLVLTSILGILLTGVVGFALIGLYLSVRQPHPEAFHVPEEIAREVVEAVRGLLIRLRAAGLPVVRAVVRAGRRLAASGNKGPRNPPGPS